jgi:DNA polymerase theta
VGGRVVHAAGSLYRQLSPAPGWEATDKELLAHLTQETVGEEASAEAARHSVLLFCGTKAQCVATAEFLAKRVLVPERRVGPSSAAPGAPPPTRAALCERLEGGEVAAHPRLLAVMARGVAFHHAGLDQDQKALVEAAFRGGAVSVLCATSTLAAGVNLPARRVIFRHAWIGMSRAALIDPTRYLQMAGRAGRAGIDSQGEAVLLKGPPAENNFTLGQLQALASSPAAPVSSALAAADVEAEGRCGMRRAMLEGVASGAVVQSDDVQRFIRCALSLVAEKSVPPAGVRVAGWGATCFGPCCPPGRGWGVGGGGGRSASPCPPRPIPAPAAAPCCRGASPWPRPRPQLARR